MRAYQLTPEQHNRLLAIMTEQVKNPARAIVNSESAFVRTELSKCGEADLAKTYWSWATRTDVLPSLFPSEIDELQHKLNQIDQSVSMPDWGTKGT